MARLAFWSWILAMLLVTSPARAGHPAGSMAGMDGGSGSSLGYGYVGLDPEGVVEADEFQEFRARVHEEIQPKTRADKLRFAALVLLLGTVCLAFSKKNRLGEKLRKSIDWFALGTVSGMLLFGVVMGSGLVLGFSYNPSPWQAYFSVETIAASPMLGFVRNLHNWSAESLLVLLLLHAARTVSTGSYLGQRKITWLTGTLLLATTWATFVAGSFLRADQEAVEGFQHIMYAISELPLGGYLFGFFSGELAVTRLLVFHASLAVLMTVWITLPHVLMRREFVHVQKRWRTALLYSAILVGLLAVQSLWMEAPLIRGLAAGPAVAGVEITKPPWPIYFIVAWENVFGAGTMMLPPLALFLLLVGFPYGVDALPVPTAKKVKWGEICFYTVALALVAVSYWAAAGEVVVHIF